MVVAVAGVLLWLILLKGELINELLFDEYLWGYYFNFYFYFYL
jgi:hypothetical protein